MMYFCLPHVQPYRATFYDQITCSNVRILDSCLIPPPPTCTISVYLPCILQDSQGDLLLALSYEYNPPCLKGVLLKATNLKKQDFLGLAGACMCGMFGVQGSCDMYVWGSGVMYMYVWGSCDMYVWGSGVM